MISTAITDIETSDLEADRGIILCCVIKSSLTKKPIILRTDDLNQYWSKGLRADDSKITAEIIKYWRQHDVLVAHNGTNFDIPFVRTRAAYWGLDRVPDFKTVDPLQIAWKKFRLKYNTLGALSDFANSGDRKDRLDLSIWRDAILNGSRDAMNKIVSHCVSDVKELNDVLKLVKPYVKILDDRGSAL